jgi:hypothetical protein
MKSSLEILKEIVHWLEEYQNENHSDDSNLGSFIIWLNSRLFSEGKADKSKHSPELLDMELSFSLVMQNRYYKAYAKKAGFPGICCDTFYKTHAKKSGFLGFC